MEGTEIRDEETGQPSNWGDIFFSLHKHCHLNKWEIMEYTLPQVTELMKSCNRYIQFEVETRMNPFGMMGGAVPAGGGQQPEGYNDTDYQEVTEDDINVLARVLGGG